MVQKWWNRIRTFVVTQGWPWAQRNWRPLIFLGVFLLIALRLGAFLDDAKSPEDLRRRSRSGGRWKERIRP